MSRVDPEVISCNIPPTLIQYAREVIDEGGGPIVLLPPTPLATLEVPKLLM